MSSTRMVFSRIALVAVAIAATPSCLPVDTRPPPSLVRVQVVGSPLVRDGIAASATRDGWSVTFDKFVMALGQLRLDGDPCTAYAEADYVRLFDARVVEPQKSGDLYALGTCGLAFRLAQPDQDTILMPGTTADDLTLMRTPGSDAYISIGGMTIYVRGSATKGSVTKTFTWPFRPRRARSTDCLTAPGGKPLQLALDGKVTPTETIELHGETLFQDKLDPSQATLRFQAYADADDHGNADGDVTFDELAKVTLADAGLSATDVVIGADSPAPGWKTLSDFLYFGLFPRVARLPGGGTCTVDVRTDAKFE